MSKKKTTEANAPDKKLAASLKAGAAAVRKRDVINVAPEPAREPKKAAQAPTPEQMRHVDYAEQEICDKGANGVEIKLGRAYRRVPLFETLAKKGSRIDAADLSAMRWYRAAHEAADASPTRCTLNEEGRGAGLPLCIPFSIAGVYLDDLHGGTLVDIIERQLGAALVTMRAVVLEDQSFSAVAIARFGSRKVPWIEQEKQRATDRKGKRLAYVDKAVPISGRHRDVIAQEFAAGLALLVAAHAPYASTTRRPHPFQADGPPVSDAEAALAEMVMPAIPLPAVDPAFLDEAGRMRRLSEIADIIRERAASDANE